MPNRWCFDMKYQECEINSQYFGRYLGDPFRPFGCRPGAPIVPAPLAATRFEG
jgi:hypothetical protein